MDFRSEVETAAERIRDRVRRTPIERSAALSNGGSEARGARGARGAGGAVWLKLENLQLTGSFKLRGATNKILWLSEKDRASGVVAASSGNHGAAVACAAAAVGTRAVVFVPEGAVSSKLEVIRTYGGEVRVHGNDCVLAEAEARRHAADRGMVYVSPYNDPLVVAGQGTLAAELAEQLAMETPGRELDAVFVTLGGGGLISGVGGFLKTIWPGVRVIACSPENSCVMHASLEAGRVLELESLPTLSDGSAGGVEPDSITFDLCRQVIDESVLVSEDEIRNALRLLIGRHHTLVEGAAATAVAAYLARREEFAEANVAIVLCGANIDAQVLKEVL